MYKGNNFTKKPNSSWNNVSKWYSKITSENGHYYHKNIIIPKLLKMLNLNISSNVLDLGCGSGVLGRSIDKNINYVGVDISKNLITEAKQKDKAYKHKYVVSDALNFKSDTKFNVVVFVLSFQNMENGEKIIENVSKMLSKDGKIYLVLNHPIFRIPRQTSWEIDPKTKLEYRRINMYTTKTKIPINMNPGNKNSEYTLSYHTPLFEIVKYLKNNNILIENIEEWTSDKVSTGKNAKQENRARNEFPLFMTIVGIKK